MKSTATLNVTTPTEREIVITRAFDAPRSLAHEHRTLRVARGARRALKSGMQNAAEGYDKLAEMLASTLAHGGRDYTSANVSGRG
jgi:hypothetical protein